MPLSGWLLYVNQHKLCHITFWPASVALAKIQHWWYVIILIATKWLIVVCSLIPTKWLIVVCSFHLSFVADVGCLSTWECNEMMQSYFSLPSVVDCCLFYFVAYAGRCAFRNVISHLEISFLTLKYHFWLKSHFEISFITFRPEYTLNNSIKSYFEISFLTLKSHFSLWNLIYHVEMSFITLNSHFWLKSHFKISFITLNLRARIFLLYVVVYCCMLLFLAAWLMRCSEWILIIRWCNACCYDGCWMLKQWMMHVDDACRWWRCHVKVFWRKLCQLSWLGCCNEWWKTIMMVRWFYGDISYPPSILQATEQ